jgi:hypothetical protein
VKKIKKTSNTLNKGSESVRERACEREREREKEKGGEIKREREKERGRKKENVCEREIDKNELKNALELVLAQSD